jgi:hypothetical protein
MAYCQMSRLDAPSVAAACKLVSLVRSTGPVTRFSGEVEKAVLIRRPRLAIKICLSGTCRSVPRAHWARVYQSRNTNTNQTGGQSSRSAGRILLHARRGQGHVHFNCRLMLGHSPRRPRQGAQVDAPSALAVPVNLDTKIFFLRKELGPGAFRQVSSTLQTLSM